MKPDIRHGLLLAGLLALTGCGVDCERVNDNRWLMECAATDPVSRWMARRTLRSAAAKLPPGRWQVAMPDGGFVLAEDSHLRLVKVLADGRQDTLDLPLKQKGEQVDLQGSDRLLPWLLEGLDELRRLRIDMRELHFVGSEPPEHGKLELSYLPDHMPPEAGGAPDGMQTAEGQPEAPQP